MPPGTHRGAEKAGGDGPGRVRTENDPNERTGRAPTGAPLAPGGLWAVPTAVSTLASE